MSATPTQTLSSSVRLKASRRPSGESWGTSLNGLRAAKVLVGINGGGAAASASAAVCASAGVGRKAARTASPRRPKIPLNCPVIEMPSVPRGRLSAPCRKSTWWRIDARRRHRDPERRPTLRPARPPARGARKFPLPVSKELPMAVTRTFSIIKPDATRRNLTGAITKMLEDAGLRVVASKRIRMTREQAEGFYAVHKERPFFGELCDFMTSGPVVVQVLEGDDAGKRNREVMGATNPADAAEGTIRKACAESIEANSVHGSDSDENAAIEIDYFFKPEEIVG